MTLVTIEVVNADGGGARAHVVVNGVGSADAWGTSEADAVKRAAAWAAEHLGEPFAPGNDGSPSAGTASNGDGPLGAEVSP